MIEGALWRKWVFFYAPMALFLLFLLFPFYWMVITSVRPGSAARWTRSRRSRICSGCTRT